MTRKIKIAFNADTMTLSDVKACVDTLETIFRAYDRYGVEDNTKSVGEFRKALEEVGATVMQHREAFEL